MNGMNGWAPVSSLSLGGRGAAFILSLAKFIPRTFIHSFIRPVHSTAHAHALLIGSVSFPHASENFSRLTRPFGLSRACRTTHRTNVSIY